MVKQVKAIPLMTIIAQYLVLLRFSLLIVVAKIIRNTNIFPKSAESSAPFRLN
jgi:hypothetical protein